MTTPLREELERVAEQAPDQLPDAAELWGRARRANRVSMVVTAAVVIGAVLFGGILVRTVDATPTQPTDQPGQLGFPDDVYDIPSRTPTTDDAGPLGPLAVVSIAQHHGFWPRAAKHQMAYGISGVDGTYRFLSLPGFVVDSDGSWTESALALSPDGTLIAYPHTAHREGRQIIDGIAVYDARTGQTRVQPMGTSYGIQPHWMVWAPDSSELLMAGTDVSEPLGDTGWRTSPSAPWRYDTASGRWAHEPAMSPTLGDLRILGWRPAAEGVPDGLVAGRSRALDILDPVSGDPLARYLLRGSHSLSDLHWSTDGLRFTAIDDECADAGDGECAGSDFRAVTGTMADRTATVQPIGSDPGPVVPLGWRGSGGAAQPFGLGGSSDQPTFVTLAVSGPEVTPLSGTILDYTTLWVSAASAAGPTVEAEPPSRPWGWDLGLALVVMALYLIRFAWGVRGMYGVRPPTATWLGVLKAVWCLDGVAVLSLVPALAIAAALVVRHVGWFDPLYVVAVMLLTWWAMSRQWAAQNLLILGILGYTLVSAVWRLDGWACVVGICAIGIAQLACLESPAAREHLGGGTRGPNPEWPADHAVPSAAGLYSQFEGPMP